MSAMTVTHTVLVPKQHTVLVPKQHAVLVLNPNATATMTANVVQQLRPLLGPGFDVQPLTAHDGPPVIDSRESFATGAAAARAALQQALQTQPQTSAVLLACFGDPALEVLRAKAGGRPVAGMAEAAMAAAALGGRRFAVLTCGPAWQAMLTERAADFGYAQELVGVWALPINGLALAADPARWWPQLQTAADAAQAAGAQALVLGGAVFVGLDLRLQTPLPVIDAVEAAADWLRSQLQVRLHGQQQGPLRSRSGAPP